MGLQYDFKPTHLTDERIQAELRSLEEKHGMTTAEFLVRYNRGVLGHSFEFINWAGLAAATQRNAAPHCPHTETVLVVAGFTLMNAALHRVLIDAVITVCTLLGAVVGYAAGKQAGRTENDERRRGQ